MNGGVEVRVVGRRVVRLVATAPIAAKVLPGPVLMLIGSAAGLLAGDTVGVAVDLAPGSTLTVRTTAATIAHPCDGGGSTTFDVAGRVGAGGHLSWLPEPLIACRGCHHHGRARLELGPGASATWLDGLALGRTGEVPGRLEQRLDVELDGRPLLRDGLRLGDPGSGWDGPAVVGGHRHVASLHLLGRRLVTTPSPGVMQLAGPGSTARFVAHRGDQLARQVAAVLPLFLPPFPDPAHPWPGPDGQPAKEAVHV